MAIGPDLDPESKRMLEELAVDPVEWEYRKAEEYNRILLRMVAGLPLTPEDELTAFQAEIEVTESPSSRAGYLFTQPDYASVFLPDDVIKPRGDQHKIQGSVPDRSIELMWKALESANAASMQRLKPRGVEILDGMIEGIPIEFHIMSIMELDELRGQKLVDRTFSVLVSASREERPEVTVEIIEPIEQSRLSRLLRVFRKLSRDKS